MVALHGTTQAHTPEGKAFDFIFESEFQTLHSYTRIIVELLSMLLLYDHEDYICTKRDAVYFGINVLTFLSI